MSKANEANILTMPFSIGETFWEPFRSPHQVTNPCPVCRGERIVTVIIGGGEELGVDCEACGVGYEGPKGTITEWTSEPGARAFVITSIAAFRDGEWEVRTVGDRQVYFSSLCRTETEAFALSVKECAEQAEENMRRQQHRRGRVAKATWTVQYHRSMIKDLKRQLAWHEAKITAKKEAL